MSREVPFCIVLLFYATTSVLSTRCVDNLPHRCLEVVKFDMDKIENHLSTINLTDVPTVKMMAAGFKCPISALPFGALKSDWSRLLLLREAQPDGSIIKRKLVGLMRILIIAYYQMEESFDVIKSDTQILQQSPGEETTTTTSKSHSSSVNQSWTTTAASNDSRTYPSPVTLFVNKDDYSTRNMSSTTKVEITTVKIPLSMGELDATTSISFVPIDVRIPNVTSSIDLSAVTAQYHSAGAVETATVAGNAASKVLGNCLKQSLTKILTRRRPNQTRYSDVMFERLKGKKYGERTPRRRNEINGRVKNVDVPAKISPAAAANDFWRYAQFPTGTPLTIFSIARPYRVQGLNGFRTNPRKSRKRASLNSDGHTKATVSFTAPGKNKGK